MDDFFILGPPHITYTPGSIVPLKSESNEFNLAIENLLDKSLLIKNKLLDIIKYNLEVYFFIENYPIYYIFFNDR